MKTWTSHDGSAARQDHSNGVSEVTPLLHGRRSSGATKVAGVVAGCNPKKKSATCCHLVRDIRLDFEPITSKPRAVTPVTPWQNAGVTEKVNEINGVTP